MLIATTTCNTNTAINAFSFEGADVRVLNRSDEPWWVLADVCKALNIDNARNVAAKLDEDEKGVQIMDTLGGPQETTIINESGLYSLILTSRKPAAKRFKKWVTSEVLPSIRKTGAYDVTKPKPRAKPIDRTFRQFFNIAKTIGLDNNQAIFKAGRITEKLYGLNVLQLLEIDSLPANHNEHTLSPREIGMQLGGLSAQKINKALLDLGFQTLTRDAKNNHIYHLTEAGRAFGRLEETSRAHTDGGVTVVRWFPAIKDRVQQQMGLTPVPQLETGLAPQGGHV